MVAQRIEKRPHHRFAFDEYLAMAEHGLLAPEERVELIDGEILDMSPTGWKHDYVVRQLTTVLSAAVPPRAAVSPAQTMHLSPNDAPEPDFVILRREALALRRHLRADDVFVLIEVADTSLSSDLRVKVPLYARLGIPETWVVDASHDRVLLYGNAEHGVYTAERTIDRGVRLVSLVLPELSLAVSDLFPD